MRGGGLALIAGALGCRLGRARARQHGEHRTALHHRTLLDDGDVLQGPDDAVDLAARDLGVRGLATSEPDQQPDLMTFLDEAPGRTGADVDVVVIGARAQSKLLELDGVLVLFGLPLLLGRLVLEAAVVEELADGRHRVGRDLDQVEILLSCHFERLHGRHDAELRPIFVDESNFRNSNRAIDARAGRRPLWHVAGLDAKALL